MKLIWNTSTLLRKNAILKVLALMTVGALSFNAIAIQTIQKKPVAPLPEPEQYTQNTDIEVIAVTGEHQLGWYRDQRYLKEVAFYNNMNNLIKDEEFHLTCKRNFRHNNSRLSKRYCQPQFFDTLKQDIALERTSLRSLDNIVIEQMSDAEYRRAVAQKREEMAALVAEKIKASPELAQKLQELLEARKAYQLAHAEKFGDLSQYAMLLTKQQRD